MTSIKINRLTMEYLESLYYELNGLKIVMNTILTNKCKYEFNVEIYNKFIKDFTDCNTKFELTKNEILLEYAPEWLGKDVTFNFINSTIELTA